MRIGIYSEPFGSGLGGAELCVAVLAAALSERYPVEIVHHRSGLTRDALALHCGVDLSRVLLRFVPHDSHWMSASPLPWRHYREIARWHADLSRGYDLFVCVTHGIPPFCQAPRGALLVLFPAQPREESGAASVSPVARLKRLYRDWEWAARMRGYQKRFAISEFVRGWTQRWWDIDTQVLYPPVDLGFDDVPKEDMILSVGRFTVTGHPKRQHEMTMTFAQMPETDRFGWRYSCVGGLGASPEDHAYFETVQKAGQGQPVLARANLERAELRALFERASIYWHAAGYGDDTVCRPQLTEHFGISTVEAMGAGCVPVVINKGAQPEIVEHGVSGFVWDTLDELQEYTARLISDEALRARMTAAARRRAQDFAREKYLGSFISALGLAP